MLWMATSYAAFRGWDPTKAESRLQPELAEGTIREAALVLCVTKSGAANPGRSRLLAGFLPRFEKFALEPMVSASESVNRISGESVIWYDLRQSSNPVTAGLIVDPTSRLKGGCGQDWPPHIL
jgi:hypothetical protein